MVLEQGAKVSELTLGLGLGQTEARHEDDLLCVDELDGQIVGGGFLHGALQPLSGARRRIGAAEATSQDGQQRTVHSLGHGDGQGHARRTDERAGHDQGDVVDGQTGHGHCGAGAGVQHGDDDRHISAADRDDEHEAVAQGEHGGQDRPEQTLVRLHAQHHEGHDGEHDEQDVPETLARQAQLLDPLDALQLAGCNQRAGEGDGADHDAQTRGDEHHDGWGFGGGQDVVQCHERGGATAHGVEHGDQLRHVGHLDLLGGDHARHGADDDADNQHDDCDAMLETVGGLTCEQHDEGHGHGEHHADGGDHVALAGGLRGVHQVQADDEHHCGQQIDEPFDDAERRAQHFGQGTHLLGLLFLLLALVGLEHLQHAVGDDVAADDVHRAQHGGQEDEHPGERTGGVRGDDDDARDDDAVDGVGARHQRGVQGGGHLADDLDADEQREDEQCDRNDDIHCFTPLPSWLPRRGRP